MSEVAKTILEQLGGRQFLLCTGAKNLVAGETSLQFSLPNRFANKGINKVRVTLDPNDTYTVEFFKFAKLDLKPIAIDSCVFVDQLRKTFTRETGLDCTLVGGR